MDNKRRSVIIFLLLAASVFGVYANALDNDFVWDDELWISQNDYIRSIRNIPEIFTRDTLSSPGRSFNYYRPMQTLSYLIDYHLYKLKPLGYHLSNIILHLFVCCLVFSLLKQVLHDEVLALGGCLLYLVFPLHSGIVAYISGRADALCAFFILLSTLTYACYRLVEHKRWLIYSLGSFMAALLSKEIAVVFPLFIIIYEYTMNKSKYHRRLWPLFFYLGVIVVYIFMRLKVASVGLVPAGARYNVFERVPYFFMAISEYLKLLIMPYKLHMGYGFPEISYLNYMVLAGAAAFILSLIYVFFAGRKNRFIFLMAGWFYIFYLPISNIYPLNEFAAGHWLYLPAIGFFGIIGYYLRRLFNKGKGARLLGIIIFGLLFSYWGINTRYQNDAYWQDNISFYQRTIELEPENYKAYNNLGNIYLDKKMYNKAAGYYQKSLEINPDFALAHYNLAYLYNLGGYQGRAKRHYERAIALKPDYLSAYCNLGNIYYKEAEYKRAKELYQQALAVSPDYLKAINNLGLIYYQEGQPEKAKAMWLRALEIDPSYQAAENNLKEYFAGN